MGASGLPLDLVQGSPSFSPPAPSLSRSPVLVLDEATARIDATTDALMQQVLRDQFPAATLLIIAHRLQDVADCTRVMVLAEGRLVEFDTPTRLLANSQGVFSGLVAGLGSSGVRLRDQILREHAVRDLYLR